MAWFSSTPPSPAGEALFRKAFPDAGPVWAAALGLVSPSPVLDHVLTQIALHRWTESRSAVSSFQKDGKPLLAAVPVVGAWLVLSWSSPPDPSAQYALNEAALFLARAAPELRQLVSRGSKEARIVLDFLEGPMLGAALDLVRPPLKTGHRGLITLFDALRPDPRVRDALLALLELPVPEEDAAWHGYTRAEALRLLVGRFPPEAAPIVVTPTPAPPQGPSDLPSLLVAEVRSGDLQRIVTALDLIPRVPGAFDLVAPWLPELLAADQLLRDPMGLGARTRALRLLADHEHLAPAVEPEDEPDTEDEPAQAPPGPYTQAAARARLLGLALEAPTAVRVAALDALRELLPALSEAAAEVAERALADPDLEVRLAGVRLLAVLAR